MKNKEFFGEIWSRLSDHEKEIVVYAMYKMYGDYSTMTEIEERFIKVLNDHPGRPWYISIIKALSEKLEG